MTNETILIIVVTVAITGLVIDIMMFFFDCVIAIVKSIQKNHLFVVNIFWNLFFAGIFTFIIAYYFLM